MYICPYVVDQFLEMVLYGSIQVKSKDHLVFELKGVFIKLKLNYCPRAAQEKDLESVFCCNCLGFIILAFSEPLHPTSVIAVSYSFTLSHICSPT